MAVYAIYICPWVSTGCVRNAFQSGALVTWRYTRVHRMDAHVRVCVRVCVCVCTWSAYECDFSLIGPCCSRDRTGPAAPGASRFGTWRSLCPSRDGRRGRWTPVLGTTAVDKSEERGRQEEVTHKHRDPQHCWLQTHPGRTHLADIVWAGGGDGFEGQLLAAHAHKERLHLLQEILHRGI